MVLIRTCMLISLIIALFSSIASGAVVSKTSNQFSLGTSSSRSNKFQEKTVPETYLSQSRLCVNNSNRVKNVIITDIHGRILKRIKPFRGKYLYSFQNRLTPGCYFVSVITEHNVFISRHLVVR